MNAHNKANWSYHSELAESLVENFGMDAAIETCQRYGWRGTLTVLLAMKYARAGTTVDD